jgi:hypothetical protein
VSLIRKLKLCFSSIFLPSEDYASSENIFPSFILRYFGIISQDKHGGLSFCLKIQFVYVKLTKMWIVYILKRKFSFPNPPYAASSLIMHNFCCLFCLYIQHVIVSKATCARWGKRSWLLCENSLRHHSLPSDEHLFIKSFLALLKTGSCLPEVVGIKENGMKGKKWRTWQGENNRHVNVYTGLN